jgi:hypothetical protein
MENQISVTVKGKDLSDVAAQMVALGQTLNSMGAQEKAEPTPKKGRGKKAKPVEEEIDEEVEETSDIEDLDEEETVEEDEESFDEEESSDEEMPKVDAKELATLKKALNTYSGKHGKDKAVKILHKYAKVSQDVLQDDLGKLLKALKV